MKTSEFKKILKPLIKQTIKEVLLEEGVLSSVVSEVAKGLTGNLVVNESKKPTKPSHLEDTRYEEERQKRIKRLNESNKFGDVFKGTRAIQEQSNPNGALAGVQPGDSGVDISAIEKIANGRWKQLI